MKHRIALTKDLSSLLQKYELDVYCSENAGLLATQLVAVLENKARIAIYQNKKI